MSGSTRAYVGRWTCGISRVNVRDHGRGGHGVTMLRGPARMLSCFALVLCRSRAGFVHFALDLTLESFLRSHVEAFAAL